MNSSPTPPFRADHVGSLLRPPELLKARAGREQGRNSAEELRAVEDAAIREGVRMQREVGLAGVTDGEFRRGSWHMDFMYQIGGVANRSRPRSAPFASAAGSRSTRRSSARISRFSNRWRPPAPHQS